ncbi:MAG: PAS domain S-box protein [Sphingomonadales bacterium]|nr:PAS domain S-box protein [Sphingomonadales bacterium]
MPRSKAQTLKRPAHQETAIAKLRDANLLLGQQKKKLEQELYEARFHLNTVLEINDTVHYLVYPQHPEKNFFSPRWEKVLGFAPRKTQYPLQEKKHHVVLDSLSYYENGLEELRKKEKICFKYQYQHPRSGKILWLQEEIALKYDILNDQEVWSGTVTDISEAEFFKEYIAESEKRFKSITDALPIMIWVTDQEDNITYFNDKSYSFFDVKKGQPLRLADFGPIIDPHHKEHAFAEWDRQKEKQLPLHLEVLITDRHNTKRYLAIEAIPRILPGGQWIGYIGGAFDLSKEYQYKQGMESAFSLLKSSEEKYRKLFENMQLGVAEVDEQEKIRYANDVFLKMCGYSLEEIVGKKAGRLFCGNKESEAILKKQHEIRKQGIESAYELQFKKKDGTRASVIISGTPLFDSKGKVKGSVGIHWDVTEVRNMEKTLLESKISKEKELIEAKLRAEEEQRVQIGRDLHDGVGQVLAYLTMQLGMVKIKNSFSATELEQLEKSARTALEQVRSLSRTLAPPALRDLGLREAVRELIDSYAILKKPVFAVDLYRQTEDYNLSLDKKTVVYRILQELLANSLKHAKANKISIRLYFDQKCFHLHYADDGKGFDPQTVKKGIGLESIRSRVDFYKGSTVFTATPGKGCSIVIQIPIT